MKIFRLEHFNEDNQNNKYFITIKDDTYIFSVRWNKYGNYGNVSIADYNNKPIVLGKALVNNLIIRNKKLPYVFYFAQQNNANYEPSLENISKEFVMFYFDEEK